MEVRIKIRYQARPEGGKPPLSKASLAASARAAVRATLIALMFLGTTIGGLEIGYGIWTYSTITRAAKLGARYAEAHNRDSSAGAVRARLTHEIEQIVRSNSGELPGERLSVETTWPAENATDPAVRVRVTYPIRFFTGSLMFASERASTAISPYQMAVTN